MSAFEYITKNTIDRFSSRIGYSLSTYLDLYSFFIQNNQTSIQNYYKNNDVQPDIDSFDYLIKLQEESDKINNLIGIHKNAMYQYDDWELLDLIEDIRIKLLSIRNSHKFLRSSKTQDSWMTNELISEYVSVQNETMEDISFNKMKSQDSDNDWVKIALQNNLSEIEYDSEGGELYRLRYKPNFGSKLYLNSVVDTMIGEKLYGIDFYRKLTWENNDLKVLSYKETFIQSLKILVELRKGHIPEFRNMGIDERLMVGSNINVFEHNKIREQLISTIETDDTIRDFIIISMDYEDNSTFVVYEANSFYNLNFNNKN